MNVSGADMQQSILYGSVVVKPALDAVGLAAVPEFIERSARNRSPIEVLNLKLRTKS